MRLATWNVNGLRSTVRRGFEVWLSASGNDIVCLQEVKTQEDLLTKTWFAGFDTHWNTAAKPGYSGVATLVGSRVNLLSVATGIGDELTDGEGRVLATELSSFVLVNAYAPHSHRKLLRVEQKRAFCRQFLRYVRARREFGKPLIVMGDLNVAHEEIDLSNPYANRKNAGFLPEEREWMTDLLNEGFVDAFRMFHKEAGHYTWWSMRKGVRERNIGWRLDYILVDQALKGHVRACFPPPEQMGSDHCPVTVEIEV